MPFVNLPLPALFSTSTDETSLPDRMGVRLVNGWVERIGDRPCIRKSPGLSAVLDLGTGYPIDGLFWWDAKNVAIVVSGGRVYTLENSGGGYTDITGDALTVQGPTTFACNNYQAIIASGGRMVSINVENLPESTPALAIGSDTSAVAHDEFTFYVGANKFTKGANASGTEPGNDVIPTGKYGAVALDIAGGSLSTFPSLSIGTSDTTKVKSGDFSYYIAGLSYDKTSAETAPGTSNIPQNLHGAVAFDIGADGTIDAVEASANATGYASSALAYAGIPAAGAGHIRMGWMIVISSNVAGFTLGTTDLDHADATVAYADNDDAAITVIEASQNAIGYNTAEKAIAGIPLCASTKARMGVVTAMKTDGAFTFGTTALSAANSHVAYTSYIRNSDCGIQATRFISSTNAPTSVTHVGWMDGYFLANEKDSIRFWFSSPDDPFAWDILDFASAEGDSDFINALHVAWMEITLFGKNSLETFYNDGSSPFSRIDGGVLERGCLAPATIFNAGGTWIWLDSELHVVSLSGRNWDIRSKPVDYEIAKVEDASGSYAVYFNYSGQDFYVITFPTVERTFAYNITTDSWSEWGDWDSDTAIFGYWPGAKSHCYSIGWDIHFFGSPTDSIIYKTVPDYYLHGSRNIRSLMRTAHVTHGTTALKRCRKLRINIKRGQGTVGGSEPLLTLRHNTDNRGWSNEIQVGLGLVGERQHIVELRSLGVYHSRQWEMCISDNCDFVLNDIEEDVEKLEE